MRSVLEEFIASAPPCALERQPPEKNAVYDDIAIVQSARHVALGRKPIVLVYGRVSILSE